MRAAKYVWFLPMLLCILLFRSERERHAAPESAKGHRRLPVSFEPNLGQLNPAVKFLGRGREYYVFLTANDAVLSFNGRGASTDGKDGSSIAVRMKLLGSNSGSQLAALEELPGKINYFMGNDPQNWHASIPTFAKVRYANVYPGIDLVYYGDEQRLEYDFLIASGADPRMIHIAFEGLDDLKLNESGNLVLYAGGRQMVQHAPRIYQTSSGGEIPIRGHYVLMPKTAMRAGDELAAKEAHLVAFQVNAYDRAKPLVIDPVLTYASYLGGAPIGYQKGLGIAVDASGNAYAVGLTSAPDFPTTPGAFQRELRNGTAAFVTKVNDLGTALVYSTFLGSTQMDDSPSEAHAVAVDGDGNAYVTGETIALAFPTTPNAFQRGGFPGRHAFVTKFNAGGGLVYSTYLAGPGGEDSAFGIALDSSRNAYVTGWTTSPSVPEYPPFPATPGAFQTVRHGDQDAFVTKLNAAGTALFYSTYLGGTGDPGFMIELGKGIAVDGTGNAYVTGRTNAPDFPVTPGAFQTTRNGNIDAFVTKLNTTGTALEYSTYLGGNEGLFPDEIGEAIAVDGDGNAFVVGSTSSSDFPTTRDVFQPVIGSITADAFVFKMNPTGSAPVWSSFLGGNSLEYGQGVKLDALGNIYVTGWTASQNFPAVYAIQEPLGPDGVQRAFVTKIHPSGFLIYSTYLGGSGGEWGQAVALDPAGSAYVTGWTLSNDFPTTPGVFQTMLRGNSDAYVAQVTVSDLCSTCQTGFSRLTGANWSICWRQDPDRKQGLIIRNACFMTRMVLRQATQPFVFTAYHGAERPSKDGLNRNPPQCNGMPFSEIPGTSTAVLETDDDNPAFPAYKGFDPGPSYDKLELATTYAVGPHRYRQRWSFRGTGEIEASLGLGGYLRAAGPEVAHFHSAYWRLDFDIDGPVKNYVEEFAHPDIDTADSWTQLTQEGARTMNPNQFTKWRVRSDQQNAQGEYHSYEIETDGQPYEFATGHAWPTVFDFTQNGEVVGLAACDDSELRNVYSSPAQSLDGNDIVFWVAAHRHHEPRAAGEEGPAPNRLPGFDWIEVKLSPRNFLNGTP